MTGTEIIVIVVGLALGYWIVAVFVPSLMQTDADLGADAGPPPGPTHERPEQPEQPVHDASAWFEVLGIPENSLREDIVAAYKRKIRQYHPDLVAKMGHELRELAELKSKQINEAYAIALKLRSGTYQA